MELIPARPSTLIDPSWLAEFPRVELPIHLCPARVYLGRLSSGSKPDQERALETLAQMLAGDEVTIDTMPWHLIGYQHSQALRAQLADRYAPGTVNRHLSALRGVLKEAWRLRLMSAEDYQSARDVENITSHRLPAGRSVNRGDLQALSYSCTEDPNVAAGVRDAALIALLYASGVRRAEAAKLNLDHYDSENGAVRVIGAKRSRDRLTYVSDEAAREAINDWLTIRGREPGPLFCPVRKGGHVELRRMTPAAVRLVLQKRVRQSGIKPASPHDMRRSFISDLLDAGADLSSVQRLVGHSSPTTTAAYDRRGEAAKQKTAALIHFPYQSPLRRGLPQQSGLNYAMDNK